MFDFLKFRKRDNIIHIGNWYTGWKWWIFELSYEECGYEDGYARINIGLICWFSVFKLPWKSKRYPDSDCDSPKWGIQIIDNLIRIYMGGAGNMDGGSKSKSWEFPFIAFEHYQHLVECKDNNGNTQFVDSRELEEKGKFYRDNERINKRYYDFVDPYDGTVVKATYNVETREWRRKWMSWTSLFNIKNKYIEVEFDGEVGRGKGSWKGGTIGCSYNMLPNETPEECIKRMEKDKKKFS